MLTERWFPVLGERWVRPIGFFIPASIPWAVVAPHERRAKRNHDQTLERLAERGGLSPYELWCLVHDRPLYPLRQVDDSTALEWLRSVAT